MNRFELGQRWISTMEPELGLGTIIDIGQRMVRIFFPASECERQYAVSTAPIKRVVFQVGDTVKTRDDRSFTVTRLDEENGIITYIGDNVTCSEKDLCDSISFTTPLERLTSGFFDRNAEFRCRDQALELLYNIRKSPVRGFVGGRIDLIPHQLYVAHQVSSSYIPRVLLSDEVGLGKTIEACLILHRLLLSGRISRVLVLVPSSLVHQWFVELLRRFNLSFRIVDERYCDSLLFTNPDGNPFLDDQLLLSSVEFLSESDLWQEMAAEAGWDMVVIDEAHHLTDGSPEYKMVQQLGQASEGLLLLTATPEQLGHHSHFSRLKLLDKARYYDFDVFEKEELKYLKVADLVSRLAELSNPVSINEQKNIRKLLPEKFSDSETFSSDKTRLQAIEALLDRHGMGRAIYRNTRSAISGFPKRVAHLAALDNGTKDMSFLSQEFQADMKNNIDIQYQYDEDPRLPWLVKLLQQKKDKVLLICRSIHKVFALSQALRKKVNINLALFHEEMTLVQRDRNAGWFAQKDGAQLLICSEIGSEGRNFQFAHHLVLFDLPPDPELLEQRIGRLDRIGQKSTIHIHVPYIKNSEYEVMARWYHEGLDAFEKNVPGIYEIYQQLGTQITEIAENKQLSQLAAFIKKTIDVRTDISHKVESGRDRLLELGSFQPKAAQQLIDHIHTGDENSSLEYFMLHVFELYGIRPEEIWDRTYQLNLVLLSDPQFPLPDARQEDLRVTFDRPTALSYEDIEFLTWDHPMVMGVIDLIIGSEKGNCSMAQWLDSGRKELLAQVLFVVECVAPKKLNIDRFFPPTPISIFVNHNLKNKSTPYNEEISTAKIFSLSELPLLEKPEIKELLPKMVRSCEKAAETQMKEILANNESEMAAVLDQEIDRLQTLKKVNDHIDQKEIDAHIFEKEQLQQAMQTARLRLDAIRLIYRGPKINS